MKFFKIFFLSLTILVSLVSCKDEDKNIWDVKIDQPQEKVSVIDISKDFYNAKVPFSEFKEKYPFFLSPGFDDAFYEKKRVDTLEISIYKKAVTSQAISTLEAELPVLFSRIKHYFPKFTTPKVYVFSSATAMYLEPIMYSPQGNAMIIDLSSFMGSKSEYYKGLEEYFRVSMNPENLLPKISQAIAFTMVPYGENQKFIDELVYSGKIQILQDAFIPQVSDALKMNYTEAQYEWAKINEVNVWNYFVESDLLFSSDPKLVDRFIAPAPFSKFYTEIDNQSSPQIGVFIGWQICKKYFQKNPDTKLQDFLRKNATEIFNESTYKPKN